jgi:DNA-binding HxlR family transcriptional regulator
MLIENRPGCIEVAAKVLGDKWTPLLIRSLATGPLRFCELQKAAGGINPRTLSARLTTLEARGIIAKNFPPAQENFSFHNGYALTAKGKDLVPILKSMAAWGDKYDPDRPKGR